MDLVTLKAVAVVAIFAVGVLGGLLPTWFASSKRSDLLLSLGNAMAGGVFLGAGLVHMLPDSAAAFAEVRPGAEYPRYAVVAGLGFLLILSIERVLVARHDDGPVGEAASPTALYPYILMLVLSVHSIIEGLAVGAEARISQVAVLLIAIMAHKGTAAFALGAAMQRGGISGAQFTRLIVFFALMTPIGAVLGMATTVLLTGQALLAFTAVFDGLAAGTFLYVAILDILYDEFERPEHRALKLGLVTLGFSIMAVLAVWA
jgi:zinc transporter 1/2/3